MRRKHQRSSHSVRATTYRWSPQTQCTARSAHSRLPTGKPFESHTRKALPRGAAETAPQETCSGGRSPQPHAVRPGRKPAGSQKTSAGTTSRAQAARSVHIPRRLPGRRPPRVQKDETRPDRLTATGRARSSVGPRNFVRPHASHACTCGLRNARNYLYKWTNWTVKPGTGLQHPSPTHGPELGQTGLTD